MEIQLERVRAAKKEALFRLLQYSLFEESSTDQNEIGDDALFDYPWFDFYFTEPEREAYFIREKENGKLLGFVMINTYRKKASNGHSIAEFVVLPKYRRQTIGKQAAFACFDKHAGIWEVSPSYGSDSAYRFWKHVIEDYTQKKFCFEDGLFTFQSSRSDANNA